MSTSDFLNGLKNMLGMQGGVPSKKSARRVSVNKILHKVYKPSAYKVEKYAVYKKTLAPTNMFNMLAKNAVPAKPKRAVKKMKAINEEDLMVDMLSSFHTSTKAKNAHSKGLPPRRSGRNREQTQRWSPTAAAKADKQKAKDAKKTRRHSTSAKKSKSRSRSHSTSPMLLDFMNLNLGK